jgi:hypothetical protein
LPRRLPRRGGRERETGIALSGPPPLAPIGLVLRRDGSFWHEGVRVTHAKLCAAFLAGVRWAEAEQTFVVQLQNFRGWLDVEDTAFFVNAYDVESGEIELSDRTRETLAAASLRVDPDEVLRCTVKGRFDARFTRAGQALLLDALEADGDALVLRAGHARLPAPGLEALS